MANAVRTVSRAAIYCRGGMELAERVQEDTK